MFGQLGMSEIVNVINDIVGVQHAQIQKVYKLRTFARLHMGFLDLNGGLGRRFGSIGVGLDAPQTEIVASAADEFTAEGVGAERALSVARKLAQALGMQAGMHMQLNAAIPEHAGLGSGTQMSLAVGTLYSRLYDLNLSTRDIAAYTSRGARSGIGLGTFDSGGVVIDAGRGKHTVIPPVIARVDFPADWQILLIFDYAKQGVHGTQEQTAFRALPDMPADVTADLCRRILMQALPALLEQDLAGFAQAITELQHKTGDHFAAAQGGRYASADVTEVLAWLQQQGLLGLGQSSWGPTSFALIADKEQADYYLQKVQAQFADKKNLKFMLCQGRNQGAIIDKVA